MPDVRSLIVTIADRPVGSLPPSSLIAAYGKEQRCRESRLGHRRTAADKRLELHPAKGLPLPFPAQEPQPLGAQEESGGVRVDSVLFG